MPDTPSAAGTAPDPKQAVAPIPPEPGNTDVPGKPEPNFVERNIGTILTFVGVLATAYVTLAGGLLKPTQPPVARIALMLGDHKVVVAEDKSPASAIPILPLGKAVVLSGASSSDPDGDLARARFQWSIAQVYPEAGDPVSFGSSEKAQASDRVIRWTPSKEGAYEAVLNVTNDRECNIVIELVAGSGCHKTATAVLHFAARKQSLPDLRVNDVPSIGSFPFEANVDAQSTRTFDDEDPQSLRFSWTLDGTPVSTAPQFKLPINLPRDPGVKEETRTLVGSVTDQWGQTGIYSRQIKPQASVTSTGAGPGPKPAAAQPGPPVAGVQQEAAIVVPERLDADLLLGLDKQVAAVELPASVLTNGHAMRIHERSIVARSTHIKAFAGPAPSGRSGAAGSIGPAGSGEGAAGEPVGPGEPGSNGSPGSAPATIEIHADAISGDLSVDDTGMPGGGGGNGGAGGAGGTGAMGSPSSTGTFDCSSGPGRGGAGGPRGPGGRGGDGGAGGPGGLVDLVFGSVASGSLVSIVAVGGQGGSAGRPGPGGPGGPGGPEGSTGGWCHSAGRGGPGGAAGVPGPEGSPGEPGALATGSLTIGADRYAASSGVLRYPVQPH